MLTISLTFIGDPLLNNVDRSREWVSPRLLQVQNGNPLVIWISEKAEMSNVPGDRTSFFLGMAGISDDTLAENSETPCIMCHCHFSTIFSFAFYIIIIIIITDRLAFTSDFHIRNFCLDYMYHYWSTCIAYRSRYCLRYFVAFIPVRTMYPKLSFLVGFQKWIIDRYAAFFDVVVDSKGKLITCITQYYSSCTANRIKRTKIDLGGSGHDRKRYVTLPGDVTSLSPRVVT